MGSNTEFQLLKLKMASEIVRSSQCAVAFSRAFYLEEILIDKISKELKDLKEEYERLQRNMNDLLKTVDLEDNIVLETNTRVFCSNIQSELDGKTEGFEEFEKQIIQAEARRQAKSSLLQKLSTNELMYKFENLSLTELREMQVPEFSCFINESDFGLLERLNEDWNFFKNELMNLIKTNSMQIDVFKTQELTIYRNIEINLPTVKENGAHNLEVPLEEIGKTFANRSSNVLQKFATLLRRGKGSKKSLTLNSFEGEASESQTFKN